MESTDARKKLLSQWLSGIVPLQPNNLQLLQGDASMRRYFRVQIKGQSLIAMDAPPPQENCRPFVSIAAALRAHGLLAPEVMAADLERGFLLLSDFGDTTYLKALNSDNVDTLYGRALVALQQLQGVREVPGRELPLFTRDFMWQEWLWHQEWFLGKLLGVDGVAPDSCYEKILDLAISQPQVFMHRDYHSGNLMVLPDSVGILDFQDAFIGPLTYDLVSLLRDCYIDWPDERVADWAWSYAERLQSDGVIATVSRQEFLRWFDWMGVQRHLKALFTFARKQVRDQQPHYLKFVPRTLNYIIRVSGRYPELAPLHAYYSQVANTCAV